jgi:hypothetical protein
MQTRNRRGALAVLLALTLAGFGLFSASPASAAPIIPIHWNVNATTHLKSLNMDVVVPTGTFDGQVDLATGTLTGNLVLPKATTDFKIFGYSIASATFSMKATGPITGHVDLAAKTVSVNSSFTFSIDKVSANILPWLNLVGNNCHGSTPIAVNMSGPLALSGASTFSATYTIPKFTGCGALVTPLLNLIIPGPGNTFSATFAPKPPAT